MVRHPILLTCQEVVELVTELFDDALAGQDRARIEQHLLVCPPCTLHVRQLADTRQLARELPMSTPPPHVLDLLRARKPR